MQLHLFSIAQINLSEIPFNYSIDCWQFLMTRIMMIKLLMSYSIKALNYDLSFAEINALLAKTL
jgi:hypothetical protein